MQKETATLYDVENLNSHLHKNLDQLINYVKQAVNKEEIHDVEKEIFRRTLQIGYLALKMFVAESGTGYEEGNPPMVDKDQSLRYKGEFESHYISIFGELIINRAGYHDESHNRYYYPLDMQLNLPDDKYSYLLTDLSLSRATETDYRESTEIFEELFGLNLTQSVPQRQCEKVSQHVDEFYEQLAPPSADTEGSHLAISCDGKGVRLVKSEREGDDYKVETPKARLAKGEKRGKKKEAIVSAAYTFNPGARTAEDIVKALLHEYSSEELKQTRAERRKSSQGITPLPRMALNKHLRATMYGKDRAMDLLMKHLSKRDAQGSKPLIILLDGDPALEAAFKRALKEYDFENRVDATILDIIHVCEYVWEAGTAIYGEKGNERLFWVRSKLVEILEGKVGYIVGGLKQIIQKRNLSKSKKKTLQKVITYFTNHKHMMKYDDYLAKGYPIGTGVIEGACGTLVKNRMERSGMRWKRTGAQAMLDTRSVKKNSDWNDFINTYIENEKDRLYSDNYVYKRKMAA